MSWYHEWVCTLCILHTYVPIVTSRDSRNWILLWRRDKKKKKGTHNAKHPMMNDEACCPWRYYHSLVDGGFWMLLSTHSLVDFLSQMLWSSLCSANRSAIAGCHRVKSGCVFLCTVWSEYIVNSTHAWWIAFVRATSAAHRKSRFLL